MFKLVLQCLLALEQLVRFINLKRLEIIKARLHQDTVDAISLARTKKDTSKLDELFNSGTTPK